ncbi:DNA/pantothenate metabolism flavoprotein [Sedimentisphaera cyanobacteriorum]|uniref:DNA/pantothenate metabolism flavoprotein n=1 Tax=Sedimentisphaera cyanobacteriorum TaxID=1940790 RepID=A0A1Q2HR15_9BACT|nr:flavoprotein [Sedimentisphaera cyanobacteriorum]AQQ09909.1 DNA/pantothenate metabolism flavoprotein [Sedimentisphaera cyanobacteriorum]
MQGKNVLLGITGGIAAYKAADVASRLRKKGASLKTIMTENACKLIQPKLIEAVSAGPVYTSMWDSKDNIITHLDPVNSSDLILVAPATANIIAKMTHGICDDLLSSALCAGWDRNLFIAPAMNNNMWNNPATQRNIQLLKDSGVKTIGPQSGHLACGTSNIGRMTEPEEIVEELCSHMGQGE